MKIYLWAQIALWIIAAIMWMQVVPENGGSWREPHALIGAAVIAVQLAVAAAFLAHAI